ncbi:MAG TPA: peptidoglycan-associated lipoprotein Pal [Geothermobacteraceae bacterium]|nr:peptidoglycan-associated lipoprotein Pal [Geothermobacteraceae bacterium]
MKKVLKMHWIVMALLCLLLAAGCAKKPAPTPVEPAPSETVMPAETVSGVAETGMNESAVSESTMQQTEAVMAELQRVHFDFDQFTLSAEARDILTANAAYLQANSGVRVRIEGHCDERGSDEYNLALGERRAQAAKDYLESLGVAADRLETISYGEELPLDAGHDEAAWAKNRRAEFKAIM